MTATDVLRRLLDERGVEYDYTDRLSEVPSYQSVSWWFNTADRAEFREYHDGSTQLLIHSSKTNLTPEQAIAATLGANDAKPTRVDLVQVVRCRDCKYCMSYWKSDYCDYFSHVTNDPDGFCAWGERRESE